MPEEQSRMKWLKSFKDQEMKLKTKSDLEVTKIRVKGLSPAVGTGYTWAQGN